MTLASTEALADIAVAVAPELAAALIAATVAQEVENAGPEAPRPSANQLSVTQLSPTISPSSLAGYSVASSIGSVASTASAAIVSSISSASASSTIASSATASASACYVCVACADSTNTPMTTSDPVDPFSQYAGSTTDNSTAAKHRKRLHSANFIEVEARANTATRDSAICGAFFSAPSYYSYNGAGIGNTYNPYYSYFFGLPRCSTYSWALTQRPTASDDKSYAAEHIYELQLNAIFLRWLANNNADLQAYLAVNNRNICTNFLNQILSGEGPQWTLTTFGAGGNIRTPRSRPLDELLGQMSGGARANELVFIDKELNVI